MSELSWKTKVYIGAAVVAVMASLLLIIKWQHDLIQKQNVIQTSFVEQKQLADGITRAQSGYATKDDLNKFAKDLDIKLDPIKKDLNEFGAKVQGVSTVRIVTEGSRVISKASDISTPRLQDSQPQDKLSARNDDLYGYIKNRQAIKLNESFGEKQSVPLGQVGFSAWQERPWDIEIYKRQYLVTNVLGVDENGKHYVYNKFTIVTGDKKYDVNITDSKFIEEYPDSKFRFWNTKLALNLGAGFSVPNLQGAINPGVAFSFISYGKTNINPDLLIAQIGLSYNLMQNNLSFNLSPILFKFNLLINNTYFGPTIGIDINRNVLFLATISTTM